MKKTTLPLIFLLKLFSSHIYFVQIKRSNCETFTGRILFKNRNPSRAAQFLDAGRSLYTPDLIFGVSCDGNIFHAIRTETILPSVDCFLEYLAEWSSFTS